MLTDTATLLRALNLPHVAPYWDDVTGPRGSWSTRLQPYYPFWEFRGSSDFAYCPIEGAPQNWPSGGAISGQDSEGANYCVVNGSIEAEIYDYRLASHTISTLQLAKREGKPFFVMAGFRRPVSHFRRLCPLVSSALPQFSLPVL